MKDGVNHKNIKISDQIKILVLDLSMFSILYVPEKKESSEIFIHTRTFD